MPLQEGYIYNAQIPEFAHSRSGKAEVLKGLTVCEEIEGISSNLRYENAVIRSAKQKGSSKEAVIAPPNTGKTTVISQHVERLQQRFAREGIDKKIVRLPWGDFLLSYLGADHGAFGYISREINHEASVTYGDAIARLLKERDDLHAVIDVPGVASRGTEVISKLAGEDLHVRALYSPEELRTRTLLFREAVHILPFSKESLPLLSQLLEEYHIDPGEEVTMQLLRTFQNSASPAAIRKVDEDLNEDMAPLILSDEIKIIPSDLRQFNKVTEPVKETVTNSDIEKMLGYHEFREQAIPRFFGLFLDRQGIDKTRRIIQKNPEYIGGNIHLRSKTLSEITPIFERGGKIRI